MFWFTSKPKVVPVTEAILKESWDKKDLLPEYGDLLTFPLDVMPSEAVTLKWMENQRPRTAIYYRVRGWFKTLIHKGDEPYYVEDWEKAWISANGSREIEVFVAEDYIHPRFKGGLPTREKHLLNLIGSQPEDPDKILTLDDILGDKSLATSSWRVKDNWAQITCNEELFYGQAANEKSRFIIYHPRRDIYQGRFKKDTAQIVFESLAAKIPDVKIPHVGIKIAAMDSQKAAQLGSLLLNVTGDSLRQFAHPDVQKIDELYKTIEVKAEEVLQQGSGKSKK